MAAVAYDDLQDRFPRVFEALLAIRRPMAEWLTEGAMPVPQSPSGVVKYGIVYRAANLHTSIWRLLRANAEDDALILTRSLFELLVNLEECLRSPDGIDGAASRFIKFMRLQQHLESREMYIAHMTLKGENVDDTEVAAKDGDARETFSEFAYVDKRGKHRWRSSWCGKTVAQLAAESDNPARPMQYRILYALGSRMVHAGPSAVFPWIYPGGLPPNLEVAVTHLWEVREEHLRLAAAFSSIFLGEIFLRSADVVPGLDLKWAGQLVPALAAQIIQGEP